jgi:vacuolar-type H+-ATPase subunit D/Vma8
VNIVDIMAAAVADPDSIQAKLLDWMFSQTTIRDALLDSIVKVVEGIENANKEQIEQTNNALKEAAILSAKTTALYKAKIAAHKDVEVKFDMLNQNEIDKLNNSIWGIFRGILDWDKTKALFEELQIVKVYDVLQQIAQKIEEFVIYEEGAYTITSENCEVVSPSEL